jgi:hypothetical protein
LRLSKVSPSASEVPLAALFGAATLLAALAARVTLALSGSFSPFPVLCPFRAMTGFPCFTCGGTRALGALAMGQWARAIEFNPLVTATALVLVTAGCASLALRLAGQPRFSLQLNRKEMIFLRCTAVAAIVANWAYLLTGS